MNKIITQLRLQKATKFVAFFIILLTLLSPVYIIPIHRARAAETLTDLERQKREAAAKAARAKALKEEKERQAHEAEAQVNFLKRQVVEIAEQESSTESKIQKNEQKLTELSTNISNIKQQEAEQKRRSDKVVQAFFKSRRKNYVDISYGSEIDVLMGMNISETTSHSTQFEAVADLMRERAVELIKTRNKLQDEEAKVKDTHTQLARLKEDQVRLRRSKQATQEGYDRLASLRADQASEYNQEMQAALKKEAQIEGQINEILTRLIAGRNGKTLPRIGASVGDRVHRAEVIGHMGSTGYSTGTHLHLEVRLNNSPVNPRGYLGGTIVWPVDPEYRITQEFGLTPYSRQMYSSGVHTGLDLAKYSGANIYAVCSGEIILDAFYGGYGRAFAHTCDGTNLVILYGHMLPE